MKNIIGSNEEFEAVLMKDNNGLPYKVRFQFKRAGVMTHLCGWCTKNCTGRWMYQYTAPVFHFEKSIDAVAFKFETLK